MRQLQKNFDRAAEFLVGRHDTLKQTLYALLTGEYQLLIGPPGTSKSFLARTVLGMFEGARLFQKQFHKDAAFMDSLIGPVDIGELMKGRLFRNMERGIVNCDLAFLDEFFRARTNESDCLLEIFNERRFTGNGEEVKCRHHSLIATTNCINEAREAQAILDRFAYCSEVNPLASNLDLMKADKVYTHWRGVPPAWAPEDRVHIDELRQVSALLLSEERSSSLSIPSHVLYLKNVLRQKFCGALKSEAGVRHGTKDDISDRGGGVAVKHLEAAALLAGRSTVQAYDLIELKYFFPTVGNERHMAAFGRVYLDVMKGWKPEHGHQIDRLCDLDELIHVAAEKIHKGGEFPLGREFTILERVLTWIGLTSRNRISFGDISRGIAACAAGSDLVAERKNEVLAVCGRTKQMLGIDDSRSLFTWQPSA